MRKIAVTNDQGEVRFAQEDKLELAAKDGFKVVVEGVNGERRNAQPSKLSMAMEDGFRPLDEEGYWLSESTKQAKETEKPKESSVLGSVVEAGKDAKRMFDQGILSGFTDELQAGSRALAEKLKGNDFTDAYDQFKAEERANIQQVRERSPIASTVGEIAGGLAQPTPIGKEASLLKTAGVLGAQGAVAAAGESEADLAGGDIKEFVKDVAIGGGIGASIPVIGAGVSKGVKKAGEFAEDYLPGLAKNVKEPMQKGVDIVVEQPQDLPGYVSVKAYKDGKKVGSANFQPNSEGFLQSSGGGLTVDKSVRGNNLGQRMYDAVEEQVGKPIIPSTQLTDDGKKFWEKRNLWKQESPSQKVNELVAKGASKLDSSIDQNSLQQLLDLGVEGRKSLKTDENEILKNVVDELRGFKEFNKTRAGVRYDITKDLGESLFENASPLVRDRLNNEMVAPAYKVLEDTYAKIQQNPTFYSPTVRKAVDDSIKILWGQSPVSDPVNAGMNVLAVRRHLDDVMGTRMFKDSGTRTEQELLKNLRAQINEGLDSTRVGSYVRQADVGYAEYKKLEEFLKKVSNKQGEIVPNKVRQLFTSKAKGVDTEEYLDSLSKFLEDRKARELSKLTEAEGAKGRVFEKLRGRVQETNPNVAESIADAKQQFEQSRMLKNSKESNPLLKVLAAGYGAGASGGLSLLAAPMTNPQMYLSGLDLLAPKVQQAGKAFEGAVNNQQFQRALSRGLIRANVPEGERQEVVKQANDAKTEEDQNSYLNKR